MVVHEANKKSGNKQRDAAKEDSIHAISRKEDRHDYAEPERCSDLWQYNEEIQNAHIESHFVFRNGVS